MERILLFPQQHFAELKQGKIRGGVAKCGPGTQRTCEKRPSKTLPKGRGRPSKSTNLVDFRATAGKQARPRYSLSLRLGEQTRNKTMAAWKPLHLDGGSGVGDIVQSSYMDSAAASAIAMFMARESLPTMVKMRHDQL